MSKSQGFSPFAKQCFVTGAVCCNILGHAATVGYPAVLLPKLLKPGHLFMITKEQASWITSVMAISMIMGNFLSTSLMDRYGRRAAHIVVCVPGLLGWFCTMTAAGFTALFIGRILLGMSFGMALPLRSVLVGEYTSPRNRGAFLTTVSLAQASGIFFVHLIGSILSWQRTALVCVFFPFISCVMTLYCPESPSYLASKGQFDKCREVFRWLRGDGEEDELEELIQARLLFNKQDERRFNVISTIKKREFYLPVALMTHAHSMMQFSGGTTMAAYSTIIIALIIGPEVDASFWMIMIDGQRIVANLIAVFIINKFNRRFMMFSTGSLSVLSHLAISGYVFAKAKGYLSQDTSWIGIVLINLQFIAVAVGMVPIPNVLTGEVFPLQYRSIGNSITVVFAAATTFIVLKAFPTLLDACGIQGTYLIFAGLMTYFLLVLFIFLPETKGKTLQQIEDELRGRPPLPDEVEERKSLHIDPRKMSIVSMHSIVDFG